MKMSLLDMTQDILSDMNSDEVSSITDTTESLQVAQIIKSVYNEIMAGKNWPHLKTFTTLAGLSDTAKPVYMRVSENIKEVVSVAYNVRKATDTRDKWETMEWKEPDEFLFLTNKRHSDKTEVTSVTDFSGSKFLIRTDKAPEYYTSFNDEYVVFDSYDSAVESTLQQNKTQLVCYMMPTFTMSDEHVPDMPAEMFPMFLAESKSTCFARLKQMVDQKAEQQSNRSRDWIGYKAWQVNGGWKMPDYGRRSRK